MATNESNREKLANMSFAELIEQHYEIAYARGTESESVGLYGSLPESLTCEEIADEMLRRVSE